MESTLLTSDNTTKLQSSRQYGQYHTQKRNRDQRNKTESPEINPCTLFLTKEARIHNGAKIASSISGAGKTGQLHTKE